MRIELTKARLKILSAIATNLAVVWTIAIFATNDFYILTRNILITILLVYLAIKAEEIIDEYD